MYLDPDLDDTFIQWYAAKDIEYDPQQPFAPYYLNDDSPDTWARLRFQYRHFIKYIWDHPGKSIEELLTMVHDGADMEPDICQPLPMVDTEYEQTLNKEFSLRYYLKDAGYPFELDKMIIQQLTWMNRPSSAYPECANHWW